MRSILKVENRVGEGVWDVRREGRKGKGCDSTFCIGHLGSFDLLWGQTAHDWTCLAQKHIPSTTTLLVSLSPIAITITIRNR